MREEYLHYLWRENKFQSKDLKLTSGESVEVLDAGWYNTDAGPDFFSGRVKIDGVIWSGNIEFHVKSSDWYAHGHHHDSAYDNVILHLVYEDNIDVSIGGRLLPTIELKNSIDNNHLKIYDGLFQEFRDPKCANILKNDHQVVEQQLEIALLQRLQRKSDEVLEQLHGREYNRREALFLCLLQAFGTTTNKLPFQELGQRLSFEIIQKESWDVRRIESLLFGTAGFLEQSVQGEYQEQLQNEWVFLKHKYKLNFMKKETWKFGGVRPSNFPTIRLAQLSQVMINWDFSLPDTYSAKNLLDLFYKELDFTYTGFWNYHYLFSRATKNKINIELTHSFKAILVINALVPYLMYLHRKESKMNYMECAFELLTLLKPEKNKYTKMWARWGVETVNAANSQSVLEQYKGFCLEKKCLQCKIGQKAIE